MTINNSSSAGFSIVIIPDTQILSMNHPAIFKQMTQWIVDHARSINLKMVLHLGDVVNNGAASEIQFHNAKAALDLIDNANIPLLIAPGNHDYDNMLAADRSLDMFNHYFGMNRVWNKSWFGGVFEEDKIENGYAKLDIDGRKFIFLALEFGPRDEVLAWVDDILQKHDDHDAIIITHSYMHMYGERTKSGDCFNPKKYPGAAGANDGEDMWMKSFVKHKNIASIYSGHQIPDNVSYRVDRGLHGNPVFQSFQNWQCTENGGEGRIRILNYNLNENKVNLQVFNPLSGLYETNEGYQVSINKLTEMDDFS
jgi:predicted phosphodiesterase